MHPASASPSDSDRSAECEWRAVSQNRRYLRGVEVAEIRLCDVEEQQHSDGLCLLVHGTREGVKALKKLSGRR